MRSMAEGESKVRDVSIHGPLDSDAFTRDIGEVYRQTPKVGPSPAAACYRRCDPRLIMPHTNTNTQSAQGARTHLATDALSLLLPFANA